MDLTAHSVTLDGEPRVLHKDAMTGAACVLHTLKLDRGLPFEFVKTLLEERLAQEEEEAVAAAAGSPAKPLPAAQPEAKSDNDAKEEETQEMGSSEGAEKSGVDAGTENGSGVKRELEDTDLEDAKAEEPQRKRRKRASLREAEAGSEPEGEIVDLASSDSEDDGKKVKGKVKGKAAKASSGDVAPGKEENVEAGGDAPDAKEKEGKKPLTWGTGFYRTRQEGPGGRVHVMLALKIPKSDPTAFTIYRPGTGRTRKAMTQRELKKRYIPLTVKAVQELWEEAHKRAGDLGKDGRPSLRHRTVHLLCGAVMRSWGAVQRALVRYLKSNERRMRVVGIITTGEESQRVVGMFVPEAAVDDVVKELTGVEGEGAAVR